ncbi:MAG: hypothetical protein PVS2B3_08520 [Steroidobacteraceae bacterium]
MNLSQLVLGSALGFLLAQGLLYALRHAIAWLAHDEPRPGTTRLTLPRPSAIVSGLLSRAGLIAAGAAVITLSAWAARDYLLSRSVPAESAADAPDVATAVPVADSPASPDGIPGPAPASRPGTSVAPARSVDPYRDPDYQIHRRAGKAVSLKERLLRRSEDKARAELIRQTQQHVRRSQYDCEAAERASRYVRGGLDVWGFASWQVKYFPVDSYTGATLPKCQAVKDVVDPSWVDLHSTVAQANRP